MRILQRMAPFGLHFALVPTTRRRHRITETAPVKEALDELRAEMRKCPAGLREDRIDFAELVILGARVKTQRLRDEREACRDLAEMVPTGSGPEPDTAAAKEVKYLGLIANYE